MERFTKERWIRLWMRLNARGDPDQVYDELIQRYSVLPRTYHTSEHVDHCYAEFDIVKSLVDDPDAIEFALAMHDIEQTEESSARYSIALADRVGLKKDFVTKCVGLVLATDHKISFEDRDKRFVMDIDLSILGQPVETFDRYDRLIREEYLHVPDAEYRIGRSIVLNKFLARGDRIYSTETFRKKYGAQAKSNLQRALARLAA